MKQDVNFSDFVDAFRKMGREEHFTYEGLRALYDYLIDSEEETGRETELDVIALCCEFWEYGDIKDFQCDFSDEYKTIDDIRDHTTVIEIPETGGFIIRCF